ncbi:MAG TPA: hypothetical protein VET65_11495 [Candidatus Limnocylindrales bacterium]|nr:hypothetical protein [Candidatus Limnocylindrales bacterium]
MRTVLHALVFVLGAYLVIVTVISAIKTFVLPRAAQVFISRVTFVTVRRIFNFFARPSRPFLKRDAVMAMYAPTSLIVLPAVWLLLVGAGFSAMFWGVGVHPVSEAIVTSGSSLFTLGFDRPAVFPAILLTFAEASLGLALVALLISYLPTIYAAFSRRETAVAMLEAAAGTPPSVREMLARHQRILGLQRLDSIWQRWQEWFADIEESHTSIAALVFFRSPQPGRSWVTAAACVLDTASVTLACLDLPPSAEAQICVRSGFVALRRLADFFAIRYDPDPQPSDPISIKRDEFDALWDDLASEQLPLKPDREQAWRDFCGWRVNYDTVVRALAALTMAPWAPWSSDRALAYDSVRVRVRDPWHR